MRSGEKQHSLDALDILRRPSLQEQSLQTYLETKEWNLLEKYLQGQANRLSLSLKQILNLSSCSTTRMREYEIWLQHEQQHLATWLKLELPDFSYMLPHDYLSTLSMELRIRYDGVVETKITLRITHVMENFELVLSLPQDTALSLSTVPKLKQGKTPGYQAKPISLTSSERMTWETNQPTPTSGLQESRYTTNLLKRWKALKGSWGKSAS